MSFVKERIGKVTTVGLLGLMAVALAVSMVFAISIGSVDIPPAEVFRIMLYKLTGIAMGDPSTLAPGSVYYDIVWDMRAPRAAMAAVVGGGLALAGVVMQASVQNPLADPYILGMSSGASLGATLSIGTGITGLLGMGLGHYGLALFAFMGSLIASFAVLGLATAGGKITSVKLILSGTVVASLFGAFTNMVIVTAANPEELQTITYWMLGSFNNMTWTDVLLPMIVLIGSVIYFVTQMRPLNTMMVGEDAAMTLGIDLSKKRVVYVLITSLLTAVCVCFCGIIGFVGLIIPHIVRGLTGNNHWKLLPLSVILGSTFLVVADLLSRTLVDQTMIPIGVITAFCGAPVFAYIMIKKTYSFSS